MGIPTLGLAVESKAHSGCSDKGNSYYFLVEQLDCCFSGFQGVDGNESNFCKGCFPGGGFFPPMIVGSILPVSLDLASR